MSVSSGPYSGPHRDRPAAGTRSGLTVEALANAAWQVLATAGAASIVLGVLVLAWPHVTLAVVGILFGIYLLASGVFQIAGAFGSHVPGAMRAVWFVSGAVCIMLGLICFRGAAESILLLGLWIGFGWLLQGVMLTAVALSTEGLPARGWQLFLGVITAIAGIVLIVSPFTSIAALTLVTGIMAIVLGVVEVFHAVRMRVEVGRLAPGAAERRPLFRSHPHPQH
jgi:uncharacterized membrane protein HdeD (DUF308 family)